MNVSPEPISVNVKEWPSEEVSESFPNGSILPIGTFPSNPFPIVVKINGSESSFEAPPNQAKILTIERQLRRELGIKGDCD
jgi:hypothetical protein